MSLEAAIRAELVADATVAGLVSTRIYPVIAPHDALLPHIVMQRVSTDRLHNLDSVTGIAYVSFQFSCFGTTYITAKQTAEAIRGVFDGMGRETIGSGGNTANVWAVWNESESDDFYGPSDGSDKPKYRVLVDYLFAHIEA